MFLFTSIAICIIAIYYAITIPTPTLSHEKILQMAQQHVKIPLIQYPLKNRVAIVTGVTSGIGYEVALELYRLGSTVILASRSIAKLEETKKQIESFLPDSPGTLHIAVLDTSDLESVSDFTKYVLGAFPHIHYLINNAGIHYFSTGDTYTNLQALVVSKQGYDLAFATNFLGHFLLTEVLESRLKQSGDDSQIPSKIIHVSSSKHLVSSGTDLLPNHELDGGVPTAASGKLSSISLEHRAAAYSNNKLAQIMHTRELQLKLNEANITSLKTISFCPGWVATNIIPNNFAGELVRKKAFSSNAAVIGILAALFDENIPGGSFVTNFYNFWTEQSWSPKFFEILNTLGLRKSAPGKLFFSSWVLLSQGFTYGPHTSHSSPESYNQSISKPFIGWCHSATEKYWPVIEVERE